MLRSRFEMPSLGRRRVARVAFLVLFSLVLGGCEAGPASSPAADDGAPSTLTTPPTLATALPPPTPTEAASTGQSRLSDGGLYRVALMPRVGAPPLGPLHEWVVRVENADGSAFEPVRIVVDGGMPQHGHGFVTTPRVTRALGVGEFLVEGVKFHMGGDWVMRVELAGAAGPDTASFDVHVGP